MKRNTTSFRFFSCCVYGPSEFTFLQVEPLRNSWYSSFVYHKNNPFKRCPRVEQHQLYSDSSFTPLGNTYSILKEKQKTLRPVNTDNPFADSLLIMQDYNYWCCPFGGPRRPTTFTTNLWTPST